jgi:SAM-dependent methyltransferase
LIRDIWEKELPSEIGFWEQIISGTHPNQEWCSDFRERASGTRTLPGSLTKYVQEIDPARLKILDVGSGPHTVLGPNFDGRSIDIVCVDPLADQYNATMQKADITPAIPVIKCDGERLTDLFPANTFHLVYSRNAIDHSYDPALVVQQMVDVCAPGGVVYICGIVNEAVRENFRGLHQWNFMPVEGDMIVWRPETVISLKHHLTNTAAVKATGGEWYICEIIKAYSS